MELADLLQLTDFGSGEKRELLKVFIELDKRGIALTLLDKNGVPEGIGGAIELRPGTMWLWFHSEKDITNVKGFIKAAHMILIGGLEMFKPWRVEAEIDTTAPDSHRRLVEHVGLKPESTMKHYGPDGQDFVKYVAIISENIPT